MPCAFEDTAQGTMCCDLLSCDRENKKAPLPHTLFLQTRQVAQPIRVTITPSATPCAGVLPSASTSPMGSGVHKGGQAVVPPPIAGGGTELLWPWGHGDGIDILWAMAEAQNVPLQKPSNFYSCVRPCARLNPGSYFPLSFLILSLVPSLPLPSAD